MPFFRRPLDISQGTLRPCTPADITAISRMLRDQAHRFLSASSADLPALLGGAPAVILTHGADVWGAAVAGWPVDDVAWLRALALADGVPVSAGLEAMLPLLASLARQRGVGRLFYAGDLAADTWLQPALAERGWVRQTDVVVYEKHGFAVPSPGNGRVRVRKALFSDLPAVVALDRLSFEPQWVKDQGILGPAIVEQPLFLIAELDDLPVGYAFITSHFQGMLVHLVRIAVDPGARGQQVGVRLLAEVVAFAERGKAESITLNTQQENRAAQRLYEWFGFRRTGESQTVLSCQL